MILRQPCNGTNAATVTTTNFKNGDFFDTVQTTGTGTTITFDNTQTIHSWGAAVKFHFAAAASTNYMAWKAKFSGQTTANAYARFYIYLTAYPTVNTRLGNFLSGSGVSCGTAMVTTTGTLRTTNSAGGTVATTTGTIPLNQWVRIEFEITGISGTNGTIAARMYSGSNLETTTADTNGSLSTSSSSLTGVVNEFRVATSASVTQTTAWDLIVSDVAFSDTAQPGVYAAPTGVYMVSEGAPVQNGVANTTLAVPYPLDVSGTPWMVLFVSNAGTTAVTLPSGWTSAASLQGNGNTVAPSVLMAIKKATGSESGNLSVTTPNARSTGKILAFAGVDATTPQDFTATTVDAAAAGTVVIPAATATSSIGALVYGATHAGNLETATPPATQGANWAEVVDNPGGAWNGTMAYNLYTTSGTTGSVTVTFSASTTRGIGVLLGLKTASAAVDLNLSTVAATATGAAGVPTGTTASAISMTTVAGTASGGAAVPTASVGSGISATTTAPTATGAAGLPTVDVASSLSLTSVASAATGAAATPTAAVASGLSLTTAAGAATGAAAVPTFTVASGLAGTLPVATGTAQALSPALDAPVGLSLATAAAQASARALVVALANGAGLDLNLLAPAAGGQAWPPTLVLINPADIPSTLVIRGPYARTLAPDGPDGHMTLTGPNGRTLTTTGPQGRTLQPVGPDGHDMEATGPEGT